MRYLWYVRIRIIVGYVAIYCEVFWIVCHELGMLYYNSVSRLGIADIKLLGRRAGNHSRKTTPRCARARSLQRVYHGKSSIKLKSLYSSYKM